MKTLGYDYGFLNGMYLSLLVDSWITRYELFFYKGKLLYKKISIIDSV